MNHAKIAKIEIPPLPLNMPVDENAYVLDQTLADEETPEGIIDGKTPTYTLESLVDAVERSISIVIRVIRSDGERSRYGDIAAEILARHYDKLLAQMGKWRFAEGKTQIQKEGMVQTIFFIRHFREGTGYVVDEQEKGEVVVRRMRVYERKIARYHPLVPKAFLIEKMGTPAALPAALMTHYVREYRQRLEQIYADGASLCSEEQYYLVNEIQQLTRTSHERSAPPHLRSDGRLVALAYALPAERVTVYSHDRDIKALVMLTRHLAPEREVDAIFLRH